jgi:di/tricarboxylate transporter
MTLWQAPEQGQIVLCVVVVLAVIAGLLRGKIPAEHVLLSALGVLVLGGAVSPGEAMSGFSNEGMASVALLFIVSEGLTRHGGLKWFVAWMLRAKYLRGQLTRMFSIIITSSSVLNNTAVVAMFVPELKRWADERDVSLSKLLIPLSYAAILGGTCTLIGTSTNLLVAGLARESAGVELGLLSLAPVGIPVALIGGLFMIVVGPMLLPSHAKVRDSSRKIEELTLAARVQPGGPLVGRRLDEISARSVVGLFPVEIEREGASIPAPSRDVRLAASDLLHFAGRARALVEVCDIEGLVLEPQHAFERSVGVDPGQTVEVVLTPRCPLVGQEIGNGRFRRQYDAAVLAIMREGQVVEPDSMQRWILSVGDRLMLEVGEQFLDRVEPHDFIILHARQQESSPVWKRALSMAMVGVMVVASALGVTSIFEAALACALGMVVLGLLSFKQALSSIDRRVIVTIAAAIGLGKAIEKTGLADLAAHKIVVLGGGNPTLSLVLVYLAASVLTQLITNNAAAVLVLPFALTAAQALDVSAMPFIIAIMFAASASFATPFGYQTNLMVYGAGNYTFGDFLRVGLPMNLLCAALVLVLIPWFFPF